MNVYLPNFDPSYNDKTSVALPRSERDPQWHLFPKAPNLLLIPVPALLTET